MTQQWDPKRYSHEAGFVATLGEPLIDLLAPQPHERVLDLGCGDGALTVKLCARGCEVVAVDSSPAQVEAAIARGLNASVADGHRLRFVNEFDAVVSNAALHWMKRPDEVLAGVSRALVDGGRFVAELGGEGNVERIVTGIDNVLSNHGVDSSAVNPWYFPAPEEYSERLEAQGFEILSIEHFPRPTPIAVDVTDWLEIFTQSFFATFNSDERIGLLAELRETLVGDLCDADGNWELDYVRLRFSTVKHG